MTTSRVLRIGTRGSALARWQADRVQAMLTEAGYRTERVVIETTGDVVQHLPLSQVGSRALFTKQIDDALLAGRIDLAVHSLKDLSTELPQGMALGAVGRRDDPTDALVGRGGIRWDELPPHAVVATSSLRRRAQLWRARPDLEVVDLRGNVDTRLAKLDAQATWGAIVLASAGLVRLGLGHRIGERLSLDLMLPAPGQGALAVTARADDGLALVAVREAMHDPSTAVAVAAERGFLRRLEGGCQVPVAALAEVQEAGRVALHGRVLSLDGTRVAEGRLAEHGAATDLADPAAIVAATALGARLAEQLLAEGAAEILAEVRAAVSPAIPEP